MEQRKTHPRASTSMLGPTSQTAFYERQMTTQRRLTNGSLNKVVTKMIAAADHLATTSVLAALIELLQWQFNV